MMQENTDHTIRTDMPETVHITLEGINCNISDSGTEGPIILWANSPQFGERFSEASEKLAVSTDRPFILFEFEFPDWNRDFSPWKMETGDASFGGGGRDTLRWIEETAIPYLDERYPDHGPISICGYSLAGLFSLWAFYESGSFKGTGCCSGSLWYENWDSYADSKTVGPRRMAYLSLGGKEPGSGNELTRTIGTQYDRQVARLKKEGVRYTFDKNPGGHFSDPVGRIVRSFVWLTEKL